MAGGKETPRQKLIGMMYLVLMALLALNVSKDVLKAFVNIDKTLIATNNNFLQTKEEIMAAFANSNAENEKKTGPYFKKATDIEQKTKELSQYITELKASVMSATFGFPLEQVMAKDANGNDTLLSLETDGLPLDNYDVPTNVLGVGEPSVPKEGPFTAKEFETKIFEYRDFLIQNLDEYKGDPVAAELISKINTTFELPMQKEGDLDVSWLAFNFYHAPIAACMAVMTSVQNNIVNSQIEAIRYLYSKVDAGSFKFNVLEAVALSKTNSVVKGEPFRAQLFMAAYDSTKAPIIEIGTAWDTTGNKVEILGNKIDVPVVGGKGQLEVPTGSVGEFKLKGVIRFDMGGGIFKNNPIEIDYQVTEPSLVISPTRMNVMYRGLANPIDISVPGFTQDKLEATMTNGSLTKDPKSGYIAKPGDGDICKISVSATLADGTKRAMGALEFRVKKTPPPAIRFAGKKPDDADLTITTAQLKAATVVKAELEDFLFDLNYEVVSFNLTTILRNGVPKTVTARSGNISGEMKDMFGALGGNQRVIIDNVSAKNLETGKVERIAGITLTTK